MRTSPQKILELTVTNRYNKEQTMRVPTRRQVFQPNSRDVRDFNVVQVTCKKCDIKIAQFKSRKGTPLDHHNWDIEYFYKATRHNWYGCKGVNINPKTSKITFECCCGNDNREINSDGRFSSNVGFDYKIIK